MRGEIVNRLIPPPGWRVEQTETTPGTVAITMIAPLVAAVQSLVERVKKLEGA